VAAEKSNLPLIQALLRAFSHCNSNTYKLIPLGGPAAELQGNLQRNCRGITGEPFDGYEPHGWHSRTTSAACNKDRRRKRLGDETRLLTATEAEAIETAAAHAISTAHSRDE
jgi:hypothetical protein